MRIVIDYRPALRVRTGVGEYVHQVARALRTLHPEDTVTLFTSSWRDRPNSSIVTEIAGARVSDHRIPVRLLNRLWHQMEWPRVERLIGASCDVAFSPHPLLLPSRASQVVMVHDLDFLHHPERTHREIQRDYPRFAGDHARRAHAVIVPSAYTAGEVQRVLNVPRDRIAVCSPGVPAWPQPSPGFRRDGYLLFMGTLERRKNVAGLLSAYSRLVDRWRNAPPLVLAGKPADDARAVLDKANEGSLAGRVQQLGYIADTDRQNVYEGARALVLPSLEEGFGMQVVEAMSLGIPVIVSRRGALPEVVADAGIVIDPTDEASLCDALLRLLTDDDLARTLASRGRARAAAFSWERTAANIREAFTAALTRWSADQ